MSCQLACLHTPLRSGRFHQALARDRGGGPHRDVQAAYRVRTAGQLVHQQLRPRVREADADLVHRQVQLLGDDHRERRGDALADLGPWQREERGAVGVHLDGDQAGRRCGGEVLQVAEVENLLRLGQRGNRGVCLLRVGRVGCPAHGDRQGGRGEHIPEEATASQPAALVGWLPG